MSRDYGWWPHYPPSRPRKVKGGIRTRSRSGPIGSTWWSQRWIEVLESFGWENRLPRGRNYARRGQVIDFKLSPGRVTARVQGSRPTPYHVEINLKTLTQAQWNTVLTAMASRAAFAAKLLAGSMPPEVEGTFHQVKVPLFPKSVRDFDADCSCPDWADLCKHIAATHYVLAEQFDRDPFMIFLLRGRNREEVLDALRKARGCSSATKREEPEEPPDPMSTESYWTLGPSFANVRVAPEPPAIDLAVLKRLGEPPFAKASPDRLRRLQAVYHAVTTKALEEANRESPQPSSVSE